MDLAWVGARAFDRVGVTDFQALLAPLVVDSHDLQAAVFEAGIPDEMLAGVGRPRASRALASFQARCARCSASTTPSSHRRTSRTSWSACRTAQSEETLSTLGASTIALPSGADISEVDGYEQQLSSIYGNSYYADAGYVTANVNLWPRALVVVANPDSYDGLTDAQREALATASEQSVLGSLDASRVEDAESVEDLCVEGIELVEASASQLDGLIQALGPVYARLGADPKSAAWLKQIVQLKQKVAAPPDSVRCEGSGRVERPGSAPRWHVPDDPDQGGDPGRLQAW